MLTQCAFAAEPGSVYMWSRVCVHRVYVGALMSFVSAVLSWKFSM